VLSDEHLSGFKAQAQARAEHFHMDQILPQYLAVYDRALTSPAS